MLRKDILIIEDLAAFEKIIYKDSRPYSIEMPVMPGTLEDKHKNIDCKIGIPPLRRRFNMLFLLLEGAHDMHLGAEYRWLKPSDLVIVPENMVFGSSNVCGCKGYCIHFKTEFLQPLLNKSLSDEFPFFDFEAEHVINVSFQESAILQEAFKDIIREFEKSSPEKDHLLRTYLYILFLRIREIYRLRKHLTNNLSRPMKLAAHFKNLVEKKFMEIRSVREYADNLHISSKHLSDVVTSTFGRSPRKIIDDMLLLEAKAQLVSTEKTVTEIALDLHFNDQSHFSHFVKRRTGLTPIGFRRKHTSNP